MIARLPAVGEVFKGGILASDLLAHTLIVDIIAASDGLSRMRSLFFLTADIQMAGLTSAMFVMFALVLVPPAKKPLPPSLCDQLFADTLPKTATYFLDLKSFYGLKTPTNFRIL